MLRLNENGSLDAEFNGTGGITVSLSASPDYVNALALQPDGKILAFGHVEAGGPPDFGIIRLNAGGTIDGTFD